MTGVGTGKILIALVGSDADGFPFETLLAEDCSMLLDLLAAGLRDKFLQPGALKDHFQPHYLSEPVRQRLAEELREVLLQLEGTLQSTAVVIETDHHYLALVHRVEITLFYVLHQSFKVRLAFGVEGQFPCARSTHALGKAAKPPHKSTLPAQNMQAGLVRTVACSQSNRFVVPTLVRGDSFVTICKEHIQNSSQYCNDTDRQVHTVVVDEVVNGFAELL